ncbi:protein-disulfide reductase DsbD domain-containing protein [Labrys neptuniae]
MMRRFLIPYSPHPARTTARNDAVRTRGGGKARRRLLAALAWLAAGSCLPAFAGSPDPALSDPHAVIRLLPGKAHPDGLAGLQIKLAPGWKTYWRSPGDAGIPPTFDWSKSQNLREITVLWPAPARFDQEGASSAVYHDEVVLPLKVSAVDPSKPVTLSLGLDYAACKTICVPAKGSADLTLSPGPAADGEGSEAIDKAASQVPVVQAIGAAGPLAIKQVQLDQSTRPARLTIEVSTPSPAALFVEGPAKWYLPVPSPADDADKADPHRFVLPLEGLPKGATLAGNELRFTLSTGEAGVESLYRLP